MKTRVVWSALLVIGCAHPQDLQRARDAAGSQLDCGNGLPEATLVKEAGGVREYEVGCDFSFVRVTCTDVGCGATARQRRTPHHAVDLL